MAIVYFIATICLIFGAAAWGAYLFFRADKVGNVDENELNNILREYHDEYGEFDYYRCARAIAKRYNRI